MDMHVVGRITDRLLPASLGRKLHYLKDMMELRAVPRLDYDTRNLAAASSMELEPVFNAPGVDETWKRQRDAIEQFRIPDGTGGVNPGDRRAVYYLVRALQPRSVLEVGTHIGASTVHIASALAANRECGSGENVSLTSVDMLDVNSLTRRYWLKNGSPFSPRQMMEKMGYEHFVSFVTGKSLEYAASCKRTFDFIFLDGDHRADTVYREISVALKLLNPGGVILLHDYFPGLEPLWSNNAVVTGPWMATERIRDEGVDATVLPLGRLPWPTKLNSSYTSLALFLRNDMKG